MIVEELDDDFSLRDCGSGAEEETDASRGEAPTTRRAPGSAQVGEASAVSAEYAQAQARCHAGACTNMLSSPPRSWTRPPRC